MSNIIPLPIKKLFMTINPQKKCPFCNGLSQCKAYSEKPCWCNNVEIPSSLIELLPAHEKDKSCICLSCINAYKNNREQFKADFLN
ncbi:cysteine-rich CWC family protein [Psychromonas sp.]|uniref:cysteine-rich CWC family protein n=1 Tax=Psychromonas sp. TaxID=1884585 RepID=UPI0039E3D037